MERCYYVSNEHNLASVTLHQRFGFREVARDVFFAGVRFEGGVGVLYEVDLPRGSSG